MQMRMTTGFLCLAAMSLAIPARGGDSPAEARKKLRVVLVAPAGEERVAGDWKAFLASRGIKSVVCHGEKSASQAARIVDLVVLVGPGRKSPLSTWALDRGKPVLGLGPYGCRVFGAAKLKNGYPYT